MPYVVQDNQALPTSDLALLFSFQPCCSHISLLTSTAATSHALCLRTFAHADPSAGTLFPSYSIVFPSFRAPAFVQACSGHSDDNVGSLPYMYTFKPLCLCIYLLLSS